MPGKTTTENFPTQSKHSLCSAVAVSGVTPLNADRLRHIYASMLKCHLARERVTASRRRINRQVFGEATLVPAMMDLRAGDILVVPFPELLPLMAAGKSLHSALSTISYFGRTRPGTGLSRSNVSVRDAVNMQIGMACGAAMVCKVNPKSNVVLALCRSCAELDRAGNILRLAGRQKLPLVIVANTWRRSARISKRNYGFPAIPVDGRDAVAVYRVAQEAIYKARKGTGPTLIECSEFAPAKLATTAHYDPIQYLESYMQRRRAWSDDWKDRITHEIEKEIAEAFKRPDSERAVVDDPPGVRVLSVCE